MFENDTRILLAEDTEITRTITRKMLNKMGFSRITETHDGTTAWAECEKALGNKKPFQLVIADWNMPGLNGIELLQRMGATEGMRNTPFILLTSNIEREHVVEAIRSGVVHYVAKPFTTISLQKKMLECWEYNRKKKAA